MSADNNVLESAYNRSRVGSVKMAMPEIDQPWISDTAEVVHHAKPRSSFLQTAANNTVGGFVKRARRDGLVPAVTAAAITFSSEAAHAKSVLGVNGALDFGPLAGDQPGGEGTGKALGINDDSLGFVLLGITILFGFLFNQWQGYQDDDEDFFDTYDSRRTDRVLSNRNRV